MNPVSNVPIAPSQGPPSDTHSNAEAVSDLREIFSRLTFCLTGVTAVNNQNHHPTLLTIDDLALDQRIKHMRSKQTPISTLLNASTALLVTNTEVVATMSCNSTSIITIRGAPIIEPSFEGHLRHLADLEAQTLVLENGDKLDDNLVDNKVDLNQPLAGLKTIYSMQNPNTQIPMNPLHEVDQCAQTPSGQSHWNSIKKMGSGFVFPKESYYVISFADHVATVEDYLNWFRSEQNKVIQANLSARFSEYIVASCWRKMERRIGHWAAVGLIYQLAAIPAKTAFKSHLTFDFNKIGPDRKLAVYLPVLAKTGALKRVSDFFPEDEDENPDAPVFPKLLERCNTSHYLYTRDTAEEFHRLVVAAMLCYSHALRNLRRVADEAERKLKEVERENQFCEPMPATPQKKPPREKKPTREKPAREKKPAPVLTPEQEAVRQTRTEWKRQQMDVLDLPMDFITMEDSKSKEASREKEESKGAKKFLERATALFLKPGEWGGESRGLLKKLSQGILREKAPATSTTSSANKIPTDGEARLKEAAVAVFLSSRLLSGVLYSAAFRRHIELLVSSLLLGAPLDSKQKEYRQFAEDHEIPFRVSRGNQTPAAWAEKEKASMKATPDPTLQNLANEKASQMGEWHGGLETDDEEDQEFRIFSNREDLALAIRGWMQLFVQHFGAQSTLEHYFFELAGEDHKVNIKSFGIKLPSEPVFLPEWSKYQQLMIGTLKKHDIENPEDLVTRFEAHFAASSVSPTRSSKDLSLSVNKALYAFQDLIEGKQVARFYNYHCETLLAGIVAQAKSPEGATAHTSVSDAEELKRVDPRVISVSKLCCPACWELIKLLGSEDIVLEGSDIVPRDFKTRGFHSTVCPVILPTWIKPEIVQKLVNIFEGYLVHELQRIPDVAPESEEGSSGSSSNHGHKPSWQSFWSARTNTSTATTGREFEAVPNGFPVPPAKKVRPSIELEPLIETSKSV